MSNVVHARESAIAAEAKAEGFFYRILDRLHEHNLKLLELHDALRACQPTASGSVCLELYPCGRGCSGCPHPRWVKYQWTEPADGRVGVMMGVNLDAQKRDPILTLARSAPHYQKTATLIRQAKSILKERSNLLAGIRSLKNTAKV